MLVDMPQLSELGDDILNWWVERTRNEWINTDSRLALQKVSPWIPRGQRVVELFWGNINRDQIYQRAVLRVQGDLWSEWEGNWNADEGTWRDGPQLPNVDGYLIFNFLFPFLVLKKCIGITPISLYGHTTTECLQCETNIADASRAASKSSKLCFWCSESVVYAKIHVIAKFGKISYFVSNLGCEK